MCYPDNLRTVSRLLKTGAIKWEYSSNCSESQDICKLHGDVRSDVKTVSWDSQVRREGRREKRTHNVQNAPNHRTAISLVNLKTLSWGNQVALSNSGLDKTAPLNSLLDQNSPSIPRAGLSAATTKLFLPLGLFHDLLPILVLFNYMNIKGGRGRPLCRSRSPASLLQDIPSRFGPEMELFHMPFERHYFANTNESKRQ